MPGNPYHQGGRRLTYRQWDEGTSVPVDVGDGGEHETTIERIISGSAAILRNQTGADQVEGTVVVIDVGHEESFVLSTDSAQTDRTVGVLIEDIPNGALGLVQIDGYCPLVFVDAVVSIGDKLYASTNAGVAHADPLRDVGAFAEALTATDATDCADLDLTTLINAPAPNGDVEDTTGGQWSGGSYQTLYARSASHSYGVSSSATPTLSYIWPSAQVFKAGVRYVLDLYAKQGATHISFVVKFGVAGGDEFIGETDDLGIDSGFEHHRLCWTPATDCTGVRFEWAEVQSAADYFLLDDLTLYSTPHSQVSAILWGAPDENGDAIAPGTYLSAVGGEKHVIHDYGNLGASPTFDLNDGNVLIGTLTANATPTLAGATNGVSCVMQLVLTQDAVGGRTIAWPASVHWPNGVAPTLSTTPGHRDRITLQSEDGGTNWDGEYGGSSGVTDHGALTGLLDDDHTQYLKETDVSAKGDLYAASANDTVGVLPIGSNGQVLTADSTQSLGVKWATPTSSSGTRSILLESAHAVPFTFDEILQASDGSDFLWASE